ncbi:centrosomal protein of 295 kDa [Rhynchocyon petersi]
MKRKIVKAGRLRLSPNEEAFVLKEDYERRRKLRLLQVREQERDIALQIREDIKQRRNQQFARLAEELRAEWEESQTQKIKTLEKLYLASLKTMGEGHRQAKENEPDWDGLARRAAERKKRAEIRHKEALKIQKHHREISMKQKTRHIKARKEALLVEKERSARIRSLPPPPPMVFENIDIKKIPSVMTTNRSTYHHLYALVNREMDTKQPDAHLAAEEEAKRLEELQKQVTKERLEQFEKAHVRGFHAMKKIHLAQNQEKLMKELKQLQQEDLARRREHVARMPPRLVELPYKRSEVNEEWQRELEFAFEDMYSADRKVKGNLILHLEPEPLPAVTDQTQDEDLDLSVEQEDANGPENLQVTQTEKTRPGDIDGPVAMDTQQVPSKILFKRLLNKIRSQKSLWTITSMSEDESEMITTTNESESKAPTVETGTIVSEEQTSTLGQDQVVSLPTLGSDTLTIESGPLTPEDKPPSCKTGSEKLQEVNELQPLTTPAQNTVLLHPQEEATRIRISARQKQIMEIEEQKQKQLELLEQIEQQKLRLETDCFQAQLEEERKRPQQTGDDIAPAPLTVISDEDSHRQMIRSYQHQLLEQNRLHKQSVDAARKQLNDYQTMLKEKYLSMSATSLVPDSTVSVPAQKPERPTVMSERWDQDQRPKLSPNKYQPTRSSKLKQSHFQVPTQAVLLQRPVEAMEILSMPNVSAKQSQEHLRLFSQAETQQKDCKLIPEDSHKLSKALSHDGPLIFQDDKKISQIPRATTFQTLNSQQMFPENSYSLSDRVTGPPLFLPLVAEHTLSSLPGKGESGRIQETLSTRSKSTFSSGHSVISQKQDRPLWSSEHITAQQGNLKALQEQLELQKEVLRARQEAQEELLLHKQEELEEQTGLPLCIPLGAPHSFASLPSTSARLGTIRESSLTKSDTTVHSGRPAASHIQNKLGSFSESDLSQWDNSKSIHEQLNLYRDRIQARREAQEVLHVHNKQSEFHGCMSSGQAESSAVPSQVAKHTVTSQSSETESGKIQQQYSSSESEKGLLSSESKVSITPAKSSSFLQQFLPLHNSLRLLQEQLTMQRDALQARHEAQAKLLLHRQQDFEVIKSGQISSSFSMAAQDSVTSLAPTTTEPKKILKLYLPEENLNPSKHLMFQNYRETSFLTCPQHSLPHQENLTACQEQSRIQGVIQDTKQETQESVHSEVDQKSPFEQTGFSSSLFQVLAESERSQECLSLESESMVPLCHHSMIPRFQERVPQLMVPLTEERGEDSLHFSQRGQENVASEQTGSCSFLPQLGQISLPAAASNSLQKPVSVQSNQTVPSSHSPIPQLQDKLLRLSQLIQPQQDNLKLLQERITTQRESFVQSRREAQEGFHLHEQWKERVSPSSFLPLEAQHSFASSSFTELTKIQESGPIKSNNTVTLSHSEIPRLPGELLDFSKPLLIHQDNLIIPQEHFNAQTNVLPPSEKTQEELVLPRQCKSEERVSCEHFVQPHYSDVKLLQKQLDVQRKNIQSTQKIQEELLLQRLSKLEEKVASEKVSSSSLLSQVVQLLPASEPQEPFPTEGSTTLISNHPEIAGTRDRPLSLSQSVMPQQDKLVALQKQLDLQRNMLPSSGKTQEELLLNEQSRLSKSESSEQCTVSALSPPKKPEYSFIPLPFAETKPKRICESYSSISGYKGPSSNFMTPKLLEDASSLSQSLSQQENPELQNQLGLQREALNCCQKTQKESLVQRQAALQQQIQKHQEILKDFIKDSQTSNLTAGNCFQTHTMEQLRECFPHLLYLARDDQEGISHANRNNSDDCQRLSEAGSTGQSGKPLDKEVYKRSSKPPLAKVKSGLNLNQHELSAIQEVDSPASPRTSILGKPDLYPDRDPMRVSVSREQSLLGSTLDLDSFGYHQQVTLKNVSGDDSGEAVKVKESVEENCAILSHAAECQEHTCVDSTVTPDNKAETQESSHEPLSSLTVSTGSFLSFENLDLSLTDAESLAEQGHRPQKSITGQEEEINLLHHAIPPMQAVNQRQNSSDVSKTELPVVEELTSGQTQVQQILDKYINEANLMPGKPDFKVPTVDLGFPELEHIFPNLHHQLFRPLEPQLDFDFSFLPSGISQNSKDFDKGSECSPASQHGTASSRSTASFTALSSLHSPLSCALNSQPDPNLAHVAAQNVLTEDIIKGSEQSFQQLLPEFSSQEGSQHADLPSICSPEARDSSQGKENQNHSSEDTLLHIMKKDVHSPVLLENVLSSSDDGNVFNHLNIQHSTPCGSTCSECSIKEQQEDKKPRCSKEMPEERLESRMVQNPEPTRADQNAAGGVLSTNPHAGVTDSQSCVRTVDMGTSVPALCQVTIPIENYIDNSSQTETLEILRTLSQPAQSELLLSSGSFSVHTSIPVWETESGQGIMEEPELTLVSTSDNSIAEADFETLNLEEKSENEAKSCFQDDDAINKHVLAETEFITVPENLQEAFFQRKKHFIERSIQRQKEIRSKTQVTEDPHVKKPTGSSSHLKGVSKDRSPAQTLKSFCQLNEAREEKVRQEVYAQNRARAREFHKKTLEKLRAKTRR